MYNLKKNINFLVIPRIYLPKNLCMHTVQLNGNGHTQTNICLSENHIYWFSYLISYRLGHRWCLHHIYGRWTPLAKQHTSRTDITYMISHLLANRSTSKHSRKLGQMGTSHGWPKWNLPCTTKKIIFYKYDYTKTRGKTKNTWGGRRDPHVTAQYPRKVCPHSSPTQRVHNSSLPTKDSIQESYRKKCNKGKIPWKRHAAKINSTHYFSSPQPPFH